MVQTQTQLLLQLLSIIQCFSNDLIRFSNTRHHKIITESMYHLYIHRADSRLISIGWTVLVSVNDFLHV